MDGGAGVAERPVHADPVEGDLGRADGEWLAGDRGFWEPGGRALRFFDQFEGPVPVGSLRGVVSASAEHLGVGSRLRRLSEPGRFQPGGSFERDTIGDLLASLMAQDNAEGTGGRGHRDGRS